MGIRIINGGILTTVQDMGRFGHQETGMAVSGVMDMRSAALANLLVGNEEGEAVLEATMLGPSMEFTEDTVIAVTGGDLGPKLDGAPLARYEAAAVKAGQTLTFSGLASGARAYIAFAGGLDVPAVLGSRSTNLKMKLGGLEGRRLAAGDSIGFRAPRPLLPGMEARKLEPEDFSAREVVLRVIMGPQDDCFTDRGIRTFLTSVYTVSNEYDRMGCRMSGEVIEHRDGGDIITDGISFGAVQVPSHGNPIVMMADHQTTGGYTKIANVISVDLPKLAQCVPGCRVRFESVGIEEAQELLCRWRGELAKIRESFAGDGRECLPKADGAEFLPELETAASAESSPEMEAAAIAAALAALEDGGRRPDVSLLDCGRFRVLFDGEENFVDIRKVLPWNR